MYINQWSNMQSLLWYKMSDTGIPDTPAGWSRDGVKKIFKLSIKFPNIIYVK